MSKIQKVVLIVSLASLLAGAFGFQAAAVWAAPAAAPASIASAASHSGFVSESQLWREFYHAVERHNALIAVQLLRVINVRHEHRVGLPR